MNRTFFFLMLLLMPVARLGAQEARDTLSRQADTVLAPAALPPVVLSPADTTPFITPKKIALFSAIVPGLGQYYNKDYWKIGLIYAGVGVAIYFAHDNLTNYNKYRRILAYRLSNGLDINNLPEGAEEPRLDNNDLGLARDYYRRNLDLTVLLTGVGYTLQVIDAVVFAHLKGFDISEDISFRARPVLMPQGGLGSGLVMKF